MSLFKTEASAHMTVVDAELTAAAGRTYPGMAHFAGSGPFGETCGKCAHYGTSGKAKKQPCRKFTQMMNGVIGNQIPPGAQACKYFERAETK
jgi:hypothetical protein